MTTHQRCSYSFSVPRISHFILRQLSSVLTLAPRCFPPSPQRYKIFLLDSARTSPVGSAPRIHVPERLNYGKPEIAYLGVRDLQTQSAQLSPSQCPTNRLKPRLQSFEDLAERDIHRQLCPSYTSSLLKSQASQLPRWSGWTSASTDQGPPGLATNLALDRPTLPPIPKKIGSSRPLQLSKNLERKAWTFSAYSARWTLPFSGYRCTCLATGRRPAD